MSVIRCFLSRDAEATRALGAALARAATPGLLLRLEGGLGAGKTTFSQGLARGLGLEEPVTSPTFTLVAEHVLPEPRPDGPSGLAHMDFYRLAGPLEALDLGLDDYLAGEDLLAIEWPERAAEVLPRSGLRIRIERRAEAPGPDGAEARWIRLEALDAAGARVLRRLDPLAAGLRERAAEPCAEDDPTGRGALAAGGSGAAPVGGGHG